MSGKPFKPLSTEDAFCFVRLVRSFIKYCTIIALDYGFISHIKFLLTLSSMYMVSISPLRPPSYFL